MSAPPSCGAVLVVEDDERLRLLMQALLTEGGYDVRAEASGDGAVRAVERERPLLAILDVCLPGHTGYEVCRRMRDRYGHTVPVLFVSGERTEAVDRVAGLLLGGDDYLVKPFDPDELLARVTSLLRRTTPGAASPSTALTRREREIFELLAEGLGNAAIAERLAISPKTVSTHVGNIYGKLGVRTRVQALAAGYRHGLLEAF
jgi:DNA-binding NarL/FixJ family response regulator